MVLPDASGDAENFRGCGTAVGRHAGNDALVDGTGPGGVDRSGEAPEFNFHIIRHILFYIVIRYMSRISPTRQETGSRNERSPDPGAWNQARTIARKANSR